MPQRGSKLRAPRSPSLFIPRSSLTYFRDQHWQEIAAITKCECAFDRKRTRKWVGRSANQCWSWKYVKLKRGAWRCGIRKPFKYFLDLWIFECCDDGSVRDFEAAPIEVRLVGIWGYVEFFQDILLTNTVWTSQLKSISPVQKARQRTDSRYHRMPDLMVSTVPRIFSDDLGSSETIYPNHNAVVRGK
jgi:hypothetical protein